MIPHVTLAERVKRYAAGTYWSGHDCVNLRVPWFTPGSLDALLGLEVLDFLREASVLELGCGGSTLFFGDLCKAVYSIETSEEWAAKVKPLVTPNVDIRVPAAWSDWVKELRFIISNARFDVAILDNDPAIYPRGQAGSLLLEKLEPKAILISDNYYELANVIPEFTKPSEWTHIDFNDKHWHGCGTRLSFRGFD